ncbi:hypothetical protein E1202_27405 [Saccharopolyspora karakumensis]|uniref:DUF8017 domain-containing protein n=1 Tax=Saccharopolyspora karakumensis TaxID=2530386 RepID=A0A4R5BCC3_9PSEU|nr:hypothetical protein [Saccharopolyspora karakumensis]TDD82400.1 hypothetical protein E1202_27405 [Saccharopolyspora karakumensis]
MSSPGGHWEPQRQYRGFDAFQQPQSPRRKKRGWLIFALALGAVVLIGAMAAVLVVGLRSQEAESQPPAPLPTTSAEPVVAGWQVVAVPKRQAVYDVPRDWEVDPHPENVHAVGPPEDAVTLTGVSHRQLGFCPGDDNSFRAMAGASARLGPDNTAVAGEAIGTFIGHAFTRDGVAPLVEQSPPVQLRLSGGLPATRINARVTLPAPAGCDASSVAVTTVATNNDGRSSVVFVAAADQGVPGAVTPETLNAIGGSLRPR